MPGCERLTVQAATESTLPRSRRTLCTIPQHGVTRERAGCGAGRRVSLCAAGSVAWTRSPPAGPVAEPCRWAAPSSSCPDLRKFFIKLEISPLSAIAGWAGDKQRALPESLPDISDRPRVPRACPGLYWRIWGVCSPNPRKTWRI